MEDREIFGRYIFSKRKEMGLTQRELAEKLHVTESAVSKWERGLSYPDITLIRELCKILQVTEHQLMTAGEEGEGKKLEQIALNHIRRVNLYKKIMIIIYAISLVTCLIINIAVQHKLSWFFIVATSVMVAASLTLVPVMVEKRKGLTILGAFTITLSLLLMTCNIYTGGNWFFLVFVAVIFGLTTLFLPFILASEYLSYLENKKVLIYFVVITILLFFLLFVCNLYTGGGWFLPIALPITLFSLILPWGLMMIIRYLKLNGYLKTALCCILLCAFQYTVNGVISRILGNNQYKYGYDFDFNTWNQSTVSGNVNALVLIAFLSIAAVFAVIGIVTSIKAKKSNAVVRINSIVK